MASRKRKSLRASGRRLERREKKRGEEGMGRRRRNERRTGRSPRILVRASRTSSMKSRVDGLSVLLSPQR